MPYLLARLQCRYGKTGQFIEIMSHLVPVLESKGWRLLGAYQNQIGTLNRIYDLWEVADANGVRGVLELARHEPEFQKWAAGLGECLESEELELLEKVPYAH